MLGEPGPGHSIPRGQIHPTGAKNWACPAPLVGPSQPGHISNHLPGIFAGCQRDLVHGRLLQRTFCIFSASLCHSTPPESPGTRLPCYAASPNDLSQLAQASSGDSSLQIPARTGVCQVNLALVMPRQSVCSGKRRQQAQGWVLGGKQRLCWNQTGLFMCFLSTIQVPSPLQTKGLQSELSTEIQPQG